MTRPSAAAASPLHVASRLDALLHTMRAIARYEELLCSAMHHIQSRRTLTAALREELLTLLGELPIDSYEHDRDAAAAALHAALVPARRGNGDRSTSSATRSGSGKAKARTRSVRGPSKTAAKRATRPPTRSRGTARS